MTNTQVYTYCSLVRSSLLRWSAVLWRVLSTCCNAGLKKENRELKKRQRKINASLLTPTQVKLNAMRTIGMCVCVVLTCCTAARLWSWAVLRLCCCWRAAVCSIRCCCWAAYICWRYWAAVLGCLCSACWKTWAEKHKCRYTAQETFTYN